MSKWKNEIKQTKPVKFSNWQVVKEMLAYEFKDLALKFKNGGWKGAVIGAGAVGLGMGLTGCITTEKPPVVQYQEVEINNIDNLSEIKNLLGNNFVLSEKVEDAVKAEFGEDAIITVASENEDGSGNILVVVDVDGVKVATTSLNILASDFNARTFASNTYTKEGNKLSYYQNQEPKEEDLQGKFTYEDALGNLTVVDLSNVDEKVLNAFEDLTLKDTGLRYDISPNAEAIFSQLLGRIISEDITIFMPTIDYDYDSTGNQTKVTLAYNQGSDIIKTVLSFEGDLLSSGSFDIDNAIQQFKENSVTKTTKTEDYSKYADHTAIISNGNKAFVVKYIDDENGSEQGQEETITFNSWEDVFNVFGKENSDLVKNKLNEILTEKLLTDQTLKSIFKVTDPNTQVKNIKILKWAFNITDNEISSVQVLAQRNEYPSSNESWVKSYQFELQNNVSLETITGKSNVNKVVEGDYILSEGDKYLDFTAFSEQVESVSYKQIHAFYSPMLSEKATDEEKTEQQEKLNIFNLLMPYAVSEKTLYSHVSVSYLESSAIPGYDLAYVFTIKCYNEIANNYEQKSFTVKSYKKEGLTIEKSCEQAIDKGEFKVKDLSSVQMISGNIIFNVGNGNQNVIEIAPYSQQSVSEKQ